ncbi:methyltransferase domain-containing protein [Rhodobacteraceae bacterium RKSG542]|uniref:methyltransferase n=1 Tax=Pseudovibrio flavus TaxID=2529854 RepID=UPI0012BCA072|nr:methyltransferase [Pseudovibrio flavus]MTI17679.1 methyltransferase domain-containing protein [Pseudovibrio flavus]
MTDINDEALAEAYNRALSLEKAGKREEAAEAYQEVLKLDPEDHGGAAVRLASMGFGATPDKAPDAYVSTLFDQHADVFDNVLVDQLGYSVPVMVADRLSKLYDRSFKSLLDLGCGTGLTGEALFDMVEHKTGVDLSEGMLEIADEKDVYEDLYLGEVVSFLHKEEEERWDLIVATDVLPYLGGLEDFFKGAAMNIEKGGVLAFSSETLPEEILNGRTYMVGAFQRFAHSETYIRELLEKNGFSVKEVEPIIVRYEQGQPVPGHLVIAESN